MKAIILVGGQGTRLRPLTCNTPKSIVPVLNRPFIVHMLSYLKQHGINNVILAMGYNPEPIKESLESYSDLAGNVTYVIEDFPLGTAGAVKNAENFFGDTFIVFNGDVLTEIDLSDMIKLHLKNKPIASIALTPVDNPSIYGVVETDEKSMVKRFIEKPAPDKVTTNMINAGIYILESEVFNKIPSNKHYMFETHLFPDLLKSGANIFGYKSDAYWIDIGTPEKYLKANRDLLRRYYDYNVHLQGESSIHDSAAIEGPVLIGPECTIEQDVRITGPSVLGPGCCISKGSVVTGSVLWAGTKIAESSIVTNCVVCANSCIENRAILEDCVIGDTVIVKSGSKLERNTRIWPTGFSE